MLWLGNAAEVEPDLDVKVVSSSYPPRGRLSAFVTRAPDRQRCRDITKTRAGGAAGSDRRV